MIKAMCRLFCSECDKMEGQAEDGSRGRARFRNIDQLKGHLFNKHRLLMCSLCLEGRKIHFRLDHFLCEDESCLAKKFIVFQSESEIKRHNALEHGGRMSLSQRSAALQIPTSFRYRQSSGQENCRGRGRTFRRDLVDNELSFAIQASLEIASAAPPSSRAFTDHGESPDVNSLISPLESIATTDSETPSRYRQALSQSSMSGTLGDSSFPPLASGPGGNQQSSQTDALSKRTMAAHLHRQSNKAANSSSSTPAWPAANRTPVQPVMSRQTPKVNSSGSAPAWQAGSRTPAQPVITSHAWPPVNAISGSASSSGQSRAVPEIGSVSSGR